MTINVELKVEGIKTVPLLEKKITDIEGVHAVEIISNPQLIKIEYNPNDISLTTICNMIEQTGIKITY